MPEIPQRHAVLFVCLGNICRSPTAEAVFRTAVQRAGIASRLTIDSAGTGEWHVGNPPDWRAIAHAAKRGYDLSPLRARQVSRADFDRFDWILAMDREVLDDLESLRPAHYAGHLGLFLDVAPHLGRRDVPDPYDGPAGGFETVLDLVEAASATLIARLEQRGDA
jgi:protein-tyrosine phosphatase